MEINLNFKTLEWKENRLILLDQTKLPEKTDYIDCQNLTEVASAIKELKVRGAPAIGIAAAYGVVLGMRDIRHNKREEFQKHLTLVIETLKNTRPTAVNLFWALKRMERAAKRSFEKFPERTSRTLLDQALRIHQEDKDMCQKIGEYGAELLKDNFTVLTHCNAGALATGGIGTALGIIYTAWAQGKRIKVFVDETRPVLQGARLTTWELKQQGIPHTLICDNTAAWVMKKKDVDCVIVGADRVAKNLDLANKIGTYNLAVLAKYHNIPFFVAAPSSTLDGSIQSGEEIEIEQRSKAEVTLWWGKKTAPESTEVFSPAFDVTPKELVTSIITDKGIHKGKRID